MELEDSSANPDGTPLKKLTSVMCLAVIKLDWKCRRFTLKTSLFSVSDRSPDIKDEFIRKSEVSESFV